MNILKNITDDIINQYIIFCKVFDEQTKMYGTTRKAAAETIRICRDRNVLREYLHNKEKEVVTIMMSLFDEEQIMKTYWKDMENTLSQEISQKVAQEKDRETAKRMIKMKKLSLEEISLCVPSLSIEELKELEAEVMQLA